MGQITSLFVHKVIRQADAGLDKQALLSSVGVDPDAPVDPSIMVSDTDYYAFFERVARADPAGVDLPLRVGASMRSDDYGAFGLAWKSAVDLEGSFRRAERYARVLTSVATYRLREARRGAWIELHRDGPRRLGMRLSNEATMASILAISREVSTAPVAPLEVCFRHPVPESADAHERHFGCPVRFGTDRDAMLFRSDELVAPNVLGDRSISRFFDSHLDQALAAVADEPGLDRRVRTQVARALSQGVPTLSDVAGRLGMSGRTLQRRLSDAGHTYQALVDEARRQLAQQLLRETRYPLAEVAFLAGFSEQSAFTRAFKRWSGQTPRSFRLSADTTRL